ncbi:alkaline serine protease-like protein [Dinothrombium tinctorium]|uniref:Alkaline serine protease-like protein n=1 Tax=Dinothrombium tinctorium TaxID=1965070 RepID=A0A443QWA8_9ACAR|nr:alkaline serine protease-like protein [Dinothrombium tinctorium]
MDRRVKYIEKDAVIKAFHSTCSANQKRSKWCLGRIAHREKGRDDYTYEKENGNASTIYILDTGIRAAHKEFGGRAVLGYNSVLSELHNSDQNGHGTCVGSLAAGVLSGTSKYARIVSVKVLNARGAGSISDICGGIDWVIGQRREGTSIMNLSLGGSASEVLDECVNTAGKNNILVVVAAGNENKNSSEVSPARAKEAFTVAASDANDKLASFSNWGSKVNLISPGIECSCASHSNDHAYVQMSGTSMASPLVAGVAATHLNKNPKLKPGELKRILIEDSTKISDSPLKQTAGNLLFNGCD